MDMAVDMATAVAAAAAARSMQAVSANDVPSGADEFDVVVVVVACGCFLLLASVQGARCPQHQTHATTNMAATRRADD